MITNTDPCPNRPASFYLDDILIPVTPHTLKISQNPKNESGSLADGRPITRPKLMDAQTFTIEFILPFFDDPNICIMDQWHERKYYTDKFWYKEEERGYYTITVKYADGRFWNARAMLDSWDYQQSAEKGSSWDFTLTFTEGYPRANIETQYVLQNPYIRTGQRDYKRVS